MRHDVLAVSLFLLSIVPGGAAGRTPDGAPPSVETVCGGLGGASFGVCNAYCEATDCDADPRASQRACASLRGQWLRLTGLEVLPCDCQAPFVFSPTAGCVCDPEQLACAPNEQPDLVACTCVQSCMRTGCSGQLCASETILTTCEFHPWYVCYDDALCEIQPDGECDWTPTDDLLQCLDDNGAP